MNKFHKIFAGLFAVLALTAFVATGAMAQDTDTDTQEVTVDASEILLLDITASSSGTTGIDDTPESPTSGDERDTIPFSFDSSDFSDTAGAGMGEGPNGENGKGFQAAEAAITANVDAELHLCTYPNGGPGTDFENYGEGTDSQSTLHVAVADNTNDLLSNGTLFPNDQYYVVGNGETDPEASSGQGQGPADCDASESIRMADVSPGAYDPTSGNLLSINYTAWYDPVDGVLDNDSADLTWTLQ